MFKNNQICIKSTKQIHYDLCQSTIISCHAPAKRSTFHQSITVGHLENEKITEIDLLGDQSCCSEGFCILIISKKSPKFTPRSYFQNSKWLPSAILDFQIYIKVMNFTSPYEQKYFHDIFPTNFALLYQIFLNFDSYPCSSGSHLVFAHRSFFLQKLNQKVFRDTFGVFVQKEKVL